MPACSQALPWAFLALAIYLVGSSGGSEVRLVSENSEKDIAKQRALDDLSWPMRELTANLIRVARGAGRAYELPRQMVTVLERMEAYRTVVGHYPSDGEISHTINLRFMDKEHRDHVSRAVDTIVQGALQAAASTLVGQSTQKSAGETEIFDGIRAVERAIETLHRERASRKGARKWSDDDI